MRNTLIATIAAFVGVALLVGGGTYAQWSASATVSGSTLSTGSLDLALSGSPAWADTSPDVYPTQPHPISVGDFLTVPGDTIRMTQSVVVEASGTAMRAALMVDVPALSGALPGISARYTLFSVNGGTRTVVPGATSIAVGTPSTVSLPGASASREYAVDIDFAFASDAPEQRLNVIAATLAAVDISLTQTRP